MDLIKPKDHEINQGELCNHGKYLRKATEKIGFGISFVPISLKKEEDRRINVSNNTMITSKMPPATSEMRSLLPFSLCFISFLLVISVLIFYVDPSKLGLRGHLRLNMSNDYDLVGVNQDDRSVITYIREIHLKKYASMTEELLSHAGAPEHLNFTDRHELTPEIASSIARFLGNKKSGVFFQSLSGSSSEMLTAPWLAETLDWSGYIVEPDPRKYFALRKSNVRRKGIEIIHACLSPTGHPQEVTLQQEVGINLIKGDYGLETDGSEGFYSRVKCFPLYTLLLAVNNTNLDVLSIGNQGQELAVLQTIPFKKVNIKLLSIHLGQYFEDNEEKKTKYMQEITQFLLSKSFKLKKQLLSNYIFQNLQFQ